MKAAAVAFAIALAFAPVGYVRREWRPAGACSYLVLGSRDRSLHGKARRRARRSSR